MKDIPSMTVEELEREAQRRIAKYERRSHLRAAWEVFDRFMEPKWRLICRAVYGPRYLIPWSQRTGRDRAVMSARIAPLALGVIAVYALMFAGVL